MSEWVDLVTPALAVFGVFLGLGLLVQSIRQSRAIRRLEDRLAGSGGAAGEAPLERLQELQERLSTSQGRGAVGGIRRTPVIAAAAVLALALAGGGLWAMFLRDDGTAGDPAAAPGQTTAAAGTTTAGAPAAPPADPSLCRNVPPLEDNALASVSIFNASGVQGAARLKIQPEISIKGYTIDLVDNPPDGRNDLQTTRVQFVDQADRRAACNVARDLGLRPVRATPMEGFTADQIGGDDVNVIVLVGLDLATG